MKIFLEEKLICCGGNVVNETSDAYGNTRCCLPVVCMVANVFSVAYEAWLRLWLLRRLPLACGIYAYYLIIMADIIQSIQLFQKKIVKYSGNNETSKVSLTYC